jgi:hypothetical protein
MSRAASEKPPSSTARTNAVISEGTDIGYLFPFFSNDLPGDAIVFESGGN